MKNGNISKYAGKQHVLACASSILILIIATLSSCKSIEAEKYLSISEIMAQKHVQTKRWLALRFNERRTIAVVCRDESIEKWAVLSDGEWQVFSLEDKYNLYLLKTSLPEQLKKFDDSRKVFLKRGDMAIFQIDNIWESMPSCDTIWYGDSSELRWKIRDSRFSGLYFNDHCDGSVVSAHPLRLSDDLVVLAEESTYSELLVALKKTGEKVIIKGAP